MNEWIELREIARKKDQNPHNKQPHQKSEQRTPNLVELSSSYFLFLAKHIPTELFRLDVGRDSPGNDNEISHCFDKVLRPFAMFQKCVRDLLAFAFLY